MPELILPCPVCGGIAHSEDGHDGHHLVYWVECSACEMNGPMLRTNIEAAIAAWNAMPRALTWTNEPPKVAGWYFQRTAGEDQTINVAYVYSGLAGLYCKCGCRNTPLKCWIGFEWAGPISPPID